MKILIVDDQKSARRLLINLLSTLTDLSIVEASSLSEARRALGEGDIDVALVDIRLSDDARNRDGLTIVQEMVAGQQGVPICVTSTSEMALIRQAIRAGAYDYILKDDLCEELITPVIEGLRARRRLESEVQRLRARVADVDAPGLIGASPAMDRLRANLRRVALTDRPVLVIGPTGAGKEVVVRALHALGPAPDAPLLDLNCGAIPENLIESQLFGHEKGAFTGAEKKTAGYFTAVGNGTLFLDEIAELPLSLQAKLLRVLETNRFRPVGSTAECRFEGRIVAATHADLTERVRQKTFREDLFYRLDVVRLNVPALSEHREDIPALVMHFVKQQRRPLRFTADALDALTRESWPGNVRQLRNLIDRLAVFAESDVITAEVLRDVSEKGAVSADDALRQCARTILQLPQANKLDAIEEVLVAEALSLSDQNKSAAARLLGVHRKVVERRLDRTATDPGGD